MKLGVLHISDIHIKNSTDKVLNVGSSIAKACYATAHQSDSFVIMVTGDIAFSCRKEEYTLAENFFGKIKKEIEAEIGREIDVFLAPGNHDCALKPENEGRTIIIEQIVKDPTKANSKSLVDDCTSVQNEFFKFQDRISTLAPVYSDKLWNEYELNVSGSVVRVSSLNAAWMSRLPEPQGQLVFPIGNYYELLESPCNLRVSLIHHPLNWYCQSSYHPLKKALRTHCNAILSGHEHSSASEEVVDTSIGNVLIFEGAALQPHGSDFDPRFSCLLFDTDENIVFEKRFKAGSTNPIEIEELQHALKKSGGCARNSQKISHAFIEFLSDAGGNFTHESKEKIVAEDVFLYPELEDVNAEPDKKYIYADQLINNWEALGKALVLGDEESGKTFLLKRAFFDIHSQGGLPIYIKASELSSVGTRELDRKIVQIANSQYENGSEVIYSDRIKKVALVDDLDRVSGGSKNQAKLIEYLIEIFGAVIITASSRYQLNEYIDSSASEALSDFDNLKIRPFGHLMRHNLIRKWCLLGGLNTKSELDKKVHDVERILGVILGKNLVPSKPIYLLILLQSCAHEQQAELQNSSFSQYYEYLIVKSLKEADFRMDHLNEMFNYLSNLAWFFKGRNATELGRESIREFNKKFCEEYATVEFDSRLLLLQRAKILKQDDDLFSFSYPYVYFLFVGKYLAANLYKDSIKELVGGYCKELYRKENANCVMFLTHHGNNPWVIDQISEVLNGCFFHHKPIEFNGDIASISALVNTTAQIVIEDINDRDVERNQLNSRRAADVSESREDPEPLRSSTLSSGEADSVLSFSSNINLMIKTSEILGHITKNYYGSLERSRKASYLEQIFDGSLRSLKAIFEEIVDQPDAFVSELERMLKERKPDLTASESKETAKKMAFQVLGMICTGFVSRVGQVVSSEKIREDISSLVSAKSSNAYRLIEIASCLVHPGHIPFEAIEKLAKDTISNNFAFMILQSLVFYHLHMFHTKDKDKQRLAASVKIGMSQSRSIDVATSKGKMLR
ncbi:MULTISPECIES: metallophosphoesterase [Pseudomonas]|uniref:STAND family AAA ATPase n=1 Tax=Pseudomonas TaxID=286 RepID=UPI0004BA79E8|nr:MULTISPECIES: metallophosphoesterase [unclassified Pseudomonas]SMF08681.1 Calcineurin-like phosphoesterase [Pseudomonas sp. LAMO17WK12:I1]